jgi:peptidoglycan/xylan/chitin deacetylase (PgdA/CDA1 family)
MSHSILRWGIRLKNMLRQAVKRSAITGGLRVAGLLHAGGMMRAARGRGAIFTLHHVRPKQSRAFDPNAHLEITPDFLDIAITALKRDGYRFIALDALPAHLASDDPQPVAVFTLDDGYRNNLEYAAPVFSGHGVPFTVFVAGGFIDRTHTLWWETLAELLERQSSLTFDFGTGDETLALGSLQQKQAVFDRFAALLHSLDEATAIARLNRTAQASGINAIEITAALTLDVAGLKTLAENPLACLGAHTISHRSVTRLSDEMASTEMDLSARRVEEITGYRPKSLAYPYGFATAVSARDHRLAAGLGFSTAVTTQPGTLSDTVNTAALPRISLNGHFQKAGYVRALASGIAFKLMGAR